MIDRDRLVKTYCDLVQIDSESGNETAMAEEMTRRLTSLGFEVETDDYGNVIAHEDGDDPFMLSGHLDTVSPGNGIKPIVDGDRITSDGSTIGGGDDNAGLAIILETLTSMREDGTTSIPVEVVLTREEEPGLIGAHKLDFSKVRSKESIVFDREGPVNRITLASPTYIAYDFTITGRAAHAGIEPENGISAIRVASEIITRLPQGRLDEGDDIQHRHHRGRLDAKHRAGERDPYRRVPHAEHGDARQSAARNPERADRRERGVPRSLHRE